MFWGEIFIDLAKVIYYGVREVVIYYNKKNEKMEKLKSCNDRLSSRLDNLITRLYEETGSGEILVEGIYLRYIDEELRLRSIQKRVKNVIYELGRYFGEDFDEPVILFEATEIDDILTNLNLQMNYIEKHLNKKRRKNKKRR